MFLTKEQNDEAKQVRVAVMLYNHIREVFILNISRKTGHLVLKFFMASPLSRGKFQDVTSMRPRPLPSGYFPITLYHPFVQLLNASLIKEQKDEINKTTYILAQ
jgi:hypothetical protein